MLKYLLITLLTFPIFCFSLDITSADVISKRKEEGRRVLERCKQNIPFYELEEGASFQDITEKVYSSDLFCDYLKNKARSQSRRFYTFSYPSDNTTVKGFLSYIPSQDANLLVFLRGGNRLLSLPSPLSSYSLYHNCNVLITSYRGSIGDGKDEFGGEDVNDVLHLVNHIPTLEKRMGPLSHNKRFILGGSRGGMQMFLALTKYKELQDYFDKAVSLSGLLDMETTISERRDMKNMFADDFGLKIGINKEVWMEKRSPTKHAHLIQNTLPVLILQGMQDTRVSPAHGQKMTEKLRENNANVTLVEFKEGNHCLRNLYKERDKTILEFLNN